MMPKQIRKSKSPTNAVLEARFDAQVENMSDLKNGLKDVLEAVSEVKLQLATMPTWENVKALHEETRDAVKGFDKTQAEAIAALKLRVEILEKDKAAVIGGWKTLALLGTLSGVLGGWAMGLFKSSGK